MRSKVADQAAGSTIVKSSATTPALIANSAR
jgi:hypothetical protein